VRKEIRISGFGGQGVVLAGYVLGKAFSLYQDLEAVMTQAYGPEARGGASSSNIVVADRPIDYPFVQQADVLVSLSQEAYARFRPEAKPQAAVCIDGGLVVPSPDDTVMMIPCTDLAEDLGRRIVANMIMLGFLTAKVDFIDREAVERAIETSVRPKTIPLNLEAFTTGYDYAIKEEKILE
jgi:2-oxoglutarate ferredoxin oxidoreductase subunit gamma